MDAYGWDVPDSQTELYRVDSNGKLGSGDLYALPNSYSVTGIYFNTKLAEQLGIDAAPTSVEEFEADMQTAKDAGILPMMTYAKDGGTSFVFQALMANNSSAEDVQNWILQKSGTFDNQAAQDAASTLQDWNNKGYMPEGVKDYFSRAVIGIWILWPKRWVMMFSSLLSRVPPVKMSRTLLLMQVHFMVFR